MFKSPEVEIYSYHSILLAAVARKRHDHYCRAKINANRNFVNKHDGLGKSDRFS